MQRLDCKDERCAGASVPVKGLPGNPLEDPNTIVNGQDSQKETMKTAGDGDHCVLQFKGRMDQTWRTFEIHVAVQEQESSIP